MRPIVEWVLLERSTVDNTIDVLFPNDNDLTRRLPRFSEYEGRGSVMEDVCPYSLLLC